MIDEFSTKLATDLVAKIDAEISHALNLVAPDWTFVDVRKRCRLERVAGIPYETLFFDDKPLLEIYPVEVEQELKSDRVVIRLTQKIRRLVTDQTSPDTDGNDQGT